MPARSNRAKLPNPDLQGRWRPVVGERARLAIDFRMPDLSFWPNVLESIPSSRAT